jgi:hypothetical protein
MYPALKPMVGHAVTVNNNQCMLGSAEQHNKQRSKTMKVRTDCSAGKVYYECTAPSGAIAATTKRFVPRYESRGYTCVEKIK